MPCATPPEPAAHASLDEACRALWLATLSLMTAYMQQQAPAHRALLARRIARNFGTLAGQPCFDAGCRARFARLQARWAATAGRRTREAGGPGTATDPLAGLAQQLGDAWRRLRRSLLPLRH